MRVSARSWVVINPTAPRCTSESATHDAPILRSCELVPERTSSSRNTSGTPCENAVAQRHNFPETSIGSPCRTVCLSAVTSVTGCAFSGWAPAVATAPPGNQSVPFLFSVSRQDPSSGFLTGRLGAIYRVQGAPSVIGPWTDATPDISADLESLNQSVSAPNGETSYFWRIARHY